VHLLLGDRSQVKVLTFLTPSSVIKNLINFSDIVINCSDGFLAVTSKVLRKWTLRDFDRRRPAAGLAEKFLVPGFLTPIGVQNPIVRGDGHPIFGEGVKNLNTFREVRFGLRTGFLTPSAKGVKNPVPFCSPYKTFVQKHTGPLKNCSEQDDSLQKTHRQQLCDFGWEVRRYCCHSNRLF